MTRNTQSCALLTNNAVKRSIFYILPLSLVYLAKNPCPQNHKYHYFRIKSIFIIQLNDKPCPLKTIFFNSVFPPATTLFPPIHKQSLPHSSTEHNSISSLTTQVKFLFLRSLVTLCL